jgi:hypothetical protein
MSDRLLKSWTRVPLIVDRRDRIPSRIPSGCAKGAAPALRTSFHISKSRFTASLSTGRRHARCQVQQSGTPFIDFNDMPSGEVSLRPDVGVSPRFRDPVYESKENGRCRNICEDSHPPRRPVSHSRKTTPAEDNRQSFAPSVITASLLDRNTCGKATHTPQQKTLRLDNRSLQKASRHE